MLYCCYVVDRYAVPSKKAIDLGLGRFNAGSRAANSLMALDSARFSGGTFQFLLDIRCLTFIIFINRRIHMWSLLRSLFSVFLHKTIGFIRRTRPEVSTMICNPTTTTKRESSTLNTTSDGENWWSCARARGISAHTHSTQSITTAHYSTKKKIKKTKNETQTVSHKKTTDAKGQKSDCNLNYFFSISALTFSEAFSHHVATTVCQYVVAGGELRALTMFERA